MNPYILPNLAKFVYVTGKKLSHLILIYSFKIVVVVVVVASMYLISRKSSLPPNTRPI